MVSYLVKFLIIFLNILGAWLHESPEGFEKMATLYIVTDRKEVSRVEIKKPLYIKPLLEYSF